jgi:hypothetical protein
MDYAANKDSTDQDELADEVVKSEDMADALGSPEERVADEDEEDGKDEDEDEEAAEEEESKAPPKKAVKGTAAGKAKAAPAAAPTVSPLFAGPRKSLFFPSFPSSL